MVGGGTRGRWAALFDSVTAGVVAAAHSPVVVVRGDLEASGPVVVVVDGSDDGVPALRFGFAEASRRGRGLLLVYAAAGEDHGAGSTAVASQSFVAEVAVCRDRFPDVAVDEKALPGPVVAGAMPGAALVVVGCRGRRRLAGLRFGSTSQALLYTSACPVAVVRRAG
ncbi:hypothetical protein GCM10009557_33480 [Virgisporangium ochraceum]|uniref:UspA domain-containing protein n=1 Tax=Virgisporangium ochraceum TaxID=65505 RepID=A0A8J4A5T7_9ACTN|nr:hypothetical protein Voc01_103700 [Virgisporangium ochraceum]